jgi:hypothetical protein
MFETNPQKTRHSDYTDWFPSMLVKYQFSPSLEWQAGVNKAISRPPIDNLTGLWVQNDGTTPPSITAPNPNLEPEHHKVYQSRLAYYFGGRSPGQLSLAYIQDEATNFIESRTYTAAQFGITDPIYANYDFISSANTVGLQRYKNFDFSYNQTLGFLPSEYLRGISVGATFSRSYANQRRNNLAPQRGTARLGYSYRRFNAALGAVWSADKPVDGIYGRVLGAMTNYDLSGSFRLTRYTSLYLQARNPTNQKNLRYESPPGVQEGKDKYLRSEANFGANWIFGVKGTF